MARTARIRSEVGIYLISLKSVDEITFDYNDRIKFLDILHKNKVSVLSYSLFNNSFILVIREDDRMIDLILRQSSIKFVKQFNKEHHRSGKVFAGRYASYPAHSMVDVWEFIANTHKMKNIDIDSLCSKANYFKNKYIDSAYCLSYFDGNEDLFMGVCKGVDFTDTGIKLSDEEMKNYIVNTFQIQPCNMVQMPEGLIKNILNQIFKVTKASARQIARITSLPLRFLWNMGKKVKLEQKNQKNIKVKLVETKENGK